MIRCFIATGNAHKVEELRGLLGSGASLCSQQDLESRVEPDETGATFEANARIKSVAWARHLGALPGSAPADWVLADDSGLEVEALEGAPGVHSARFAALDDGRPGNSPDAENNAKLLRLLDPVPDDRRRARFRCVLAFTPVLPGAGEPELQARTLCFDGVCSGRITRAPAGPGGFGYDPLFVPDGYAHSFAELGEAVKRQLSHRARAAEALRRHLNAEGGRRK
ncbi:MAG: non-canonical purine NTP pyrophosphatase [Verrucomicrobiae bacterium]|nr:non-canonical purine NTP pyrophosphatase [Verrucomicrobiae bacterium]